MKAKKNDKTRKIEKKIVVTRNRRCQNYVQLENKIKLQKKTSTY